MLSQFQHFSLSSWSGSGHSINSFAQKRASLYLAAGFSSSVSQDPWHASQFNLTIFKFLPRAELRRARAWPGPLIFRPANFPKGRPAPGPGPATWPVRTANPHFISIRCMEGLANPILSTTQVRVVGVQCICVHCTCVPFKYASHTHQNIRNSK